MWMFPPLRENCLLPHVDNHLESQWTLWFSTRTQFFTCFLALLSCIWFLLHSKNVSVNGVNKGDKVEKAEESLSYNGQFFMRTGADHIRAMWQGIWCFYCATFQKPTSGLSSWFWFNFRQITVLHRVIPEEQAEVSTVLCFPWRNI